MLKHSNNIGNYFSVLFKSDICLKILQLKYGYMIKIEAIYLNFKIKFHRKVYINIFMKTAPRSYINNYNKIDS